MRLLLRIRRRLLKTALAVSPLLGILCFINIMLIMQHTEQMQLDDYFSKSLDTSFLGARVFLEIQSRKVQAIENKDFKNAYNFDKLADFEYDSNKFWWIRPTERKDWVSKSKVFNHALNKIRKILVRNDTGDLSKVRSTFTLSQDKNTEKELQYFQNFTLKILRNKQKWRVVFLTNAFAFSKLNKERDIISLFLGWKHKRSTDSNEDHAETLTSEPHHLLSQNNIGYYPCTASGSHQTHSQTRVTSSIPGNYSCHSDLSVLQQPEMQFDPRYFAYHDLRHNLVIRDWRLYRDTDAIVDEWDISCLFCHSMPSFITYIHIIHDAILEMKGVVYTSTLKIYPLMWVAHKRIYPENRDTLTGAYRTLLKDTLYTIDETLCPIEEDLVNIRSTNVLIVNEVFSISVKFAAENFGHSLLESLTRLSMYVSFLQKNSQMPIHTGNPEFLKDYLKIFGLTNELISGTVIAKRIYLPEGNAPYSPSVHYLQTTSHYVRKYAKTLVRDLGELKQNTIIFVRRTLRRSIKQDRAVDVFLEQTATEYNLRYVRFSDDHATLSINEVILLFHKAVLVVGAHGAGLSNIVFSQPNTSVIEIQCPPPWTASTFRHVAYKLGMRFHSMMGHPQDGVDPLSGRPNTVHCDHGLKIHNMDFFRRTVISMLDMTLKDIPS